MTEDSGLGQLALGISTSLGISVTAGVLESRTVFQLMQLSEPLVRWGLVVLFQGVLWSTSHKGTSIFHLLHKTVRVRGSGGQTQNSLLEMPGGLHS